jgi:hypothetical protein
MVIEPPPFMHHDNRRARGSAALMGDIGLELALLTRKSYVLCDELTGHVRYSFPQQSF